MFDLWVPTGELVGCVADVVPFACPDEEVPDLFVVRVEWDGQCLHTYATDRSRLGWSRWEPDDAPFEVPAEDDLFTNWGAGEPGAWQLNLSLPDAKQLVKMFKLAKKRARVPLMVTAMTGPGGRLIVERHADSGYPAVTASFDHRSVDFPGVAALLAKVPAPRPVGEIAFTPRYLADIGRVRQRGPLQMRFAGPGRMVLMTMGDRFTAAIVPATVESPAHTRESTSEGER
jgi:hypothetical protein